MAKAEVTRAYHIVSLLTDFDKLDNITSNTFKDIVSFTAIPTSTKKFSSTQ